MKYLKFVLLFLILFYSCAYPDRDPAPDSTVFFVNNSDKSLLEYSVTNYYPDTLIHTGNPFARLVKLFVIEPYFTSKRGTCWKSYLSKSSTGVMTIFLLIKLSSILFLGIKFVKIIWLLKDMNILLNN